MSLIGVLQEGWGVDVATKEREEIDMNNESRASLVVLIYLLVLCLIAHFHTHIGENIKILLPIYLNP